ncbi:HAMP domain-containing protein [Aliidiomarina halalkaliphila]|uniref:Sensor protein n=2 Tax=Aliidiomarina halalkaliphila TaxID=2593535 RepID=A0A552X6C5_9GAMM|nr:HAMP domain-containing protein [Aliidiomarina halalkaliphila]
MSLVTRISFGLLLIVTLSVMTLIASYWLSDRVNQDPQAMNIAGSLRMQTYHAGLLAMQGPGADEELARITERLQATWEHPTFRRFSYSTPAGQQSFQEAYQGWQELQPMLLNADMGAAEVSAAVSAQVERIEQVVMHIQRDAEGKIAHLRAWLIISLIVTVLVASIVMYSLKTRFEQPLIHLSNAAQRIGAGDFTTRVHIPHQDELGSLAKTINKMSDTIGFMYGRLEQRVQEQTEALQHSHTTLMFLYDIAQKTNEKAVDFDNFEKIIQKLRGLLNVPDIELCLLTEKGKAPYLQVQGSPDHNRCVSFDCDDCMFGEEVFKKEDGKRSYRFPLRREQQNFGVLVCRLEPGASIAEWQHQLLRSVSDQLALALSVRNEEDQVRRLTLMKERTVIARELHDSLAQALSYLKIQVTRLNKALAANNQEIIADVSQELKQGLDSAYRQLRELLTTFRLKVDGGGFIEALQNTVAQLQNQSQLKVHLDYRIDNVHLAPHEEIHLLQIIREASQNAIHHSEGQNLWIRLQQLDERRVQLAVEDDGVGIPDTPEKLNHYGLAIIRERGRHLGGDASIEKRESGGTGVYFEFTPQYMASESSTTEAY